MGQPVWNGTRSESDILMRAIAQNCNCEFDPSGARRSTCAPHTMLTHDQRALDGLLFMRHICGRLMSEEFAERAPAAQQSQDGPAGTLLSNR